MGLSDIPVGGVVVIDEGGMRRRAMDAERRRGGELQLTGGYLPFNDRCGRPSGI